MRLYWNALLKNFDAASMRDEFLFGTGKCSHLMNFAEDGVVDSAAFYLSETRNIDRATHASNHPSHASALLRPINTNNNDDIVLLFFAPKKRDFLSFFLSFFLQPESTPDSVMRGV